MHADAVSVSGTARLWCCCNTASHLDHPQCGERSHNLRKKIHKLCAVAVNHTHVASSSLRYNELRGLDLIVLFFQDILNIKIFER